MQKFGEDPEARVAVAAVDIDHLHISLPGHYPLKVLEGQSLAGSPAADNGIVRGNARKREVQNAVDEVLGFLAKNRLASEHG